MMISYEYEWTRNLQEHKDHAVHVLTIARDAKGPHPHSSVLQRLEGTRQDQ